MPDNSPFDEVVHLGGFGASATGPAIPVVIARVGGGYLNCTDPATGKNAILTATIRRWNPTRRTPLNKIISTCILTEVDPPHGRYLFDWLVSDLAAVPTDPGTYVLQVDILHPSGQEYPTQQALFEVRATAPRPYN